MDTLASPAALLAPDEPPAVTVVNPHGPAPVVLLCEHAARRVPARLGTLGVPAADMERHIAWDIGAEAVTRALARRLDAPAVIAGYSRLVVDLNRPLDSATLMPAVSDGTPVLANQALTDGDRQARLDALFHPYHAAVATCVDAKRAAGQTPAIISVHSFTPVMNGFQRPWHLGVLWDQDGRLPLPLLELLRALPGVVVGDNVPYSGRDGHGYTLKTHSTRPGLPGVLIEIRQDLIGDAVGVEHWSALLAQALGQLIGRPDIHHVLAGA
ncbi:MULTISPECIES: N-formylglutamate amidohydrolase [Nitrospirillum]|uniref:Putative N-formylglutamate amidohydrolase n=1 Tax=Nitrospirillum amazonense TaxID=28077 RepID=A0A560EWA1_9PROT|nr:N-formylglutamate amidohydrolase [Nitrospirillum amazonense]MEC4594858.1 N-formylglutamate amidohydrolase [Nitrospirillum amazonense]TWB13656.1 putative N-formylglutamate amidohydrolase [Nitrospirillum amazonense]